MIRLKILAVAVCCTFCIIVARLLYIQVLSPDSFESNDYLRTVRIVPKRGIITERHGEPLVINQARYDLFAETTVLTIDKLDLVNRLDPILTVGEATLSARLDTNKSWVALDRDVSQDQKRRIERLKIHGLGFDETSRRFYPEASLSAHLLGFVGKDDDGDAIGYFGLEGYYNKDLEGLPGILKTERDVLGRPIAIGTQDKLEGEDGRKLVLTLDKNTQRIAKEKLVQAVERYQAKSGCVTVADPRTMAIYALTCVPDFDPREYFSFTENEFKNPAVTDVFEPGSIFKPLVVASALDAGVIEPDDTYDEKGPIKKGKYFIRTWNDEYHGKVTISQILQNSSNVGMVFIGEKLGKKRLFDAIESYGFGKKTGIDVQGEVAGNLKPFRSWYDIDFATATFGQGIAVSQIQMITAFSSIINGGWLMQPYVVGEMIADNGEVQKIKPKKIRRVISDKASAQIRSMLRDVVLHGEAKWKVPAGYEIGGKTGTAQIAVSGAYDASKTNASFIGFVPVENPQLIMLVTLHQPATSPWASETSAPLFFDIVTDLIVEYNIRPR